MYDERHRKALLDYLRIRRAADGPTFRVERSDIEQVGASIGLTPEQSSDVFADMKGVDWQGYFHTVEEEHSGWIFAMVERVA